MGYPVSAQQSFRAQQKVASRVEETLQLYLNKAPREWYTTVRVKQQESFMQKLETGRFGDGTALEDFVGAMIVVPVITDIGAAVDFVRDFYVIEEQRPRSFTSTSKPADVFRFDDLRMYGHLRRPRDLPDGPIYKARVEIQVKTFLQHAWSVATHDLIYKYDQISWPRSRVAAQVKALLEHAELSIATIDALEASAALPAEGQPEKRLRRILNAVLADWDRADLPSNLKRLAENLDALARACGVEDVARLLARGKSDLRGHPLGWTPYECLVDYVSRYDPESLRAALADSAPRALTIWITPDVLRRAGLTLEEATNAVL